MSHKPDGSVKVAPLNESHDSPRRQRSVTIAETDTPDEVGAKMEAVFSGAEYSDDNDPAAIEPLVPVIITADQAPNEVVMMLAESFGIEYLDPLRAALKRRIKDERMRRNR